MSSWGLELDSDVGPGSLYGTEVDSDSEVCGGANVVGRGRITVLLAVVVKLLLD